MNLYGVIGAGGLGREVAPLARHTIPALHGADSNFEVVFVVEDAFFSPQPAINGRRLLSMSQFLNATASKRQYTVAIGNSEIRERIVNSIPPDLAQPFSVVAQNHVSLENNILGEGAILCSFTHITSNTKIGRFFHANIYSYVAHDCVIGDFVTLAPGVMCNGHVQIEDHAYIGAGAVIKDGTQKPIIIGHGAVVGMGAVVTKSVPPGAVVLGNPARLRELQHSGTALSNQQSNKVE
ncbi:MAG: acetyltransferase [Pseudomonadota bacterium]